MAGGFKGLLDKIQKKQGTEAATIEKLAAVAVKEAEKPTRPNSNLSKAARVAKLAVYVTAEFTFITSGKGTVFFKQSSFNAKRLGMKIKDTGVITRKVRRNGVERTQVVKETTVQTMKIKVSIGRQPTKRKTPTKGGRAIRGGGKTVGGGLSSFAKSWITINVPKSATALDIVAYVESFSKPIYEVSWNGSSIALLPYKTGLGNNK
jgi:hypothetical protein